MSDDSIVMSDWLFVRTLILFASVGFLAGCESTHSGMPTILPQQASAAASRGTGDSFHVLYLFKGTKDGAAPAAALTNVGGKLYGTTGEGGSKGCGYGFGCGTAFTITSSGLERVVHNFGPPPDGWNPLASLTNITGTLYGTTEYGGGSGCPNNFGCGSIYKIGKSGSETVLHVFGSGQDGAQPLAPVVAVKGDLYGTTYLGGGSGYGTVFRMTVAGKETVLHNFAGGSDGEYPYASLTEMGRTLYGTAWGGGNDCQPSGGCGVVFSITTDGKETVLHSFAGGSDGSNPNAALISVKGKLYGTTSPSVGCGSGGSCGTVFSITPGGKETVLHNFGNGNDGSQPIAPLLYVKGMLYGTTKTGGQPGCGVSGGCGTVYSISTTGTEKVLHSFGGGVNGSLPIAGLAYLGDKLYGTTVQGGKGCKSTDGCGIVFTLSP
jgi:uncharacterized repeat protein (TIGR03803 family)